MPGRLRCFAKRQLELRPFALGLHFGLTHSRFELQKRQLLFGEFLASGAIFLDPRQPQELPQIAILQLCVVQVFFQRLKPHRRFSQIFNELLSGRSSQPIYF